MKAVVLYESLFGNTEARRLRRAGYQVMLPPESFFVEHTGGPLCEGEADRARRWGAQLAQQTAARQKGRSFGLV